MTLRHAILLALDRVHPRLMAERTLVADVNLILPNAVTGSEVRAALRTLDDKGWVTGIRGELTEEMKWRIADAGRAALAETQ